MQVTDRVTGKKGLHIHAVVAAGTSNVSTIGYAMADRP